MLSWLAAKRNPEASAETGTPAPLEQHGRELRNLILASVQDKTRSGPRAIVCEKIMNTAEIGSSMVSVHGRVRDFLIAGMLDQSLNDGVPERGFAAALDGARPNCIKSWLL